MYFTNNFKYLKLIKNVSLPEIEKATGLSSLGNYSSGKAFPQLPALIKLAEYFNVTIDDLLLKDLSNKPSVEDPPADYVAQRFDELEAKILALKKEIDEYKRR